MSYNATIKDGREIYIPTWAVDVALENVTKAGKYLGTNHVINISSLKLPAAIVALMEAEDPKQATNLIKHFICQVRIDGNKITLETIDDMFEGNLIVVLELFTHVMYSQYNDFFEQGLAKEPSLGK